MKMSKDFSKHLAAFANRSVHMEIGPAAIYIESVKGCPFSCAMCHFQKTERKHMPKAMLKKVEPFFEDLEIMAIHGQGEPLLADLDYFVDHSVRNDFVLHMNTTGFLLTQPIIDLLLRTRLSIRFSIHAGKEETYRRVMGYDLAKFRRKISYLTEKAAESNHRSDFWFSFIVMKENIDEIENFLHLANDCGIRSVRFMRLLSNWQTLKGIRLEDRNFKFQYFEQYNKKVKEKFFSRLKDYQDLANQLGIKIEYGSILSNSEKPRPVKESLNSLSTTAFGKGIFPLSKVKGSCLAPWIGQPVISLNGDVRLCCSSNCILGNINESTLLEIWNSDRMKRVRTSFAEGYIPKSCGYCRGFDFNNYPNNAFESIERSNSEGLR